MDKIPKNYRSKCYFGCEVDGPLHYFPNPKNYKQVERFNAWRGVLDIASQTQLHDEYIYSALRLCNRHFETRFIVGKKLTRHAIPTLNIIKAVQNAKFKIVADTPAAPLSATTGSSPELSVELGRVQPGVSRKEHNTVLLKNPSANEDDDVEIDLESEENFARYENRKDAENWKLKLTHILHKTDFCGICLNVGEGMNAMSDELAIKINDDVTCNNTLRHIVNSVFKETDYPLANSQICKRCTQELIRSYIFIRSAQERWKVLNDHLDELYHKTCYIRNNDLIDKQAGSGIYNVLIPLNKGFPKISDCDIKLEEPKTNENKSNHHKAKQKVKCRTCNLILPSHRVWKVHETTIHKNNHKCRICLQSFKTRQDFTTHHRVHLKSRCTIFHRTVQDRSLLQHLKRHRHSIHLCSTCDVAFYSAETLERHKGECHIAYLKCVTCLKSLSQDELELHQCRFKCPECSEAPCVHHKYLMSYREQVLSLADRARCSACSYVCTSKGALVAHVNAQHLNVQPLS